MYSKKEETKASKTLSYILRHAPEDINLVLDENGWASIEELIVKLNTSDATDIIFNKELVLQAVKNNDKQRFAVSEDGLMIRANQGHTIEVDLDLVASEPPEVLYHGTVKEHFEEIFKDGLKPMKRNHVHLSYNETIAQNVGMRHGKPVILSIDAKKMHEDGFKFYCSKNNVWLTDNVPPIYIKEKSALTCKLK